MQHNTAMLCAIMCFGLHIIASYPTDTENIISERDRCYFPTDMDTVYPKYRNKHKTVHIIQYSQEYGSPRWQATYQSKLKNIFFSNSQTMLQPYWHRPISGVPNWLGEFVWKIAPHTVKKRISRNHNASLPLHRPPNNTSMIPPDPPQISIPQHRRNNNMPQEQSPRSLDTIAIGDDSDSISESSTISTIESNILQPKLKQQSDPERSHSNDSNDDSNISAPADTERRNTY